MLGSFGSVTILAQVVVAQLSHIAELAACFYYSHVANEDDDEEAHEGNEGNESRCYEDKEGHEGNEGNEREGNESVQPHPAFGVSRLARTRRRRI